VRRRPSQSFYSVGELARMSGVSSYRIATLLTSNGVQFAHVGRPMGRRKRVVFLSELERAMPELVDSVRFRNDDD